MPADMGLRQVEFSGQGGADRHAVRPQRRQCADGAAKLQGDIVLKIADQADAHADEAGGPVRRLEGEGDRHRLLQKSAAGHDGVFVGLGKLDTGADGGGDIGKDQLQTASCLHHQGGIDDILAGRAPMDPAACVLGDMGRQSLDQRNSRIAGIARCPPDCV